MESGVHPLSLSRVCSGHEKTSNGEAKSFEVGEIGGLENESIPKKDKVLCKEKAVPEGSTRTQDTVDSGEPTELALQKSWWVVYPATCFAHGHQNREDSRRIKPTGPQMSKNIN